VVGILVNENEMKNFGPALCGIAQHQTLRVNISREFETEFKNILGC
jgi:hypothetical protein